MKNKYLVKRIYLIKVQSAKYKEKKYSKQGIQGNRKIPQINVVSLHV